VKEKFLGLWKKYFPSAELPIIFFYTDDKARTRDCSNTPEHRCVIANLTVVRKGTPLRLEANSVECSGGKRYLGFSRTLRPNFEYFLSYGIPGELEGERYKKSPELVKKFMKRRVEFTAPKKFIVFKRFDSLEESDNPDVVIFFAQPDVLAGLFTLASFDETEESGVIAPFGAGCGSIVLYPYLEKKSKRPRCIVGMFDPSARPYVPADVLSFSIPLSKFIRMVDNMEESFLITPTWNKIRQRINHNTSPDPGVG
jgi:uncharacterized protein (DUF169 family)